MLEVNQGNEIILRCIWSVVWWEDEGDMERRFGWQKNDKKKWRCNARSSRQKELQKIGEGIKVVNPRDENAWVARVEMLAQASNLATIMESFEMQIKEEMFEHSFEFVCSSHHDL